MGRAKSSRQFLCSCALWQKILGQIFVRLKGVLQLQSMRKTIMFKIFLMAVVSLFCMTGCNTDSPDNKIPNIESDASIQQGVFGQALSYSDEIPNDGPWPSSDLPVDVFHSDPAVESEYMPFLSVYTNHRGFYEIPLNVGAYCLCVFSSENCTRVAISENDLQRIDISVAAGWPRWHPETDCR